MAVSNIEALIIGSSLQFKWKNLIPEARAVSIQIATDSNFTKHYSHFVFPPLATGSTLEVGAGAWYFRFGVWNGKDHVGDVTWTPTYGPAVVICAKPTLAPPTPSVVIHKSYAVPEGFIIQSNIVKKSIICVEICKNSADFEANNTNMKYYLDLGTGQFDIRGFDTANSYALRIATFPSPSPENFPSTTLFHMPAGVTTPLTPPLAPIRHAAAIDRVNSQAGMAMLREASERPIMKFSSTDEYLRFKKSKTAANFH